MTLATTDDPLPVDREAILKTLNLNPRDPKTQALVLVCQQYGLDPVLKHAVLISGNLYVTRDGLLAVAHRSGKLDGIVVEDEGQTADEWWAKVSVYVKGQTHPYTYKGRYPKSGHQKKYGPEMAIKCAEVMALRRAFGVTGVATLEEQAPVVDAAIDAQVVDPPAMTAGNLSPQAVDRLNSEDPPVVTVDVPSFVDPPAGKKPLEGWERALHARMGEVFPDHKTNDRNDFRRLLVARVTGDNSKSSRDLTQVERERFHELLGAVEAGDWVFVRRDPDGWELVRGDAEVVAGPVVGDGVDAVEVPARGNGPAADYPQGWNDRSGPAKNKALRLARDLAGEHGLPVPGSFDEIDADLACAVVAKEG